MKYGGGRKIQDAKNTCENSVYSGMEYMFPVLI